MGTRRPLVVTEDRKATWESRDLEHLDVLLVEARRHPNAVIGLHCHEFTEIALVTSGKGLHRVEDDEFETATGDVFAIPVGVRHGYASSDGFDIYNLLLHPRFTARHQGHLRSIPGYLRFFTLEPFFRRETRFRHRLTLDKAALDEAVDLLQAIETESSEGRPGAAAMVEALAVQFVIWLCRQYHACFAEREAAEPPHFTTGALQRVFDMVRESYMRDLRLEDLARAACMQRTAFCRMFRKCTGTTPMDYLREYRVDRAAELLAGTDRPVARIGMEVGLGEPAQFSRTFRSVTGLSPGRYRQR